MNKRINYKMMVIGILLPNGELVDISKKEGYDYHIKYFKELKKTNVFVNDVLKNIDLSKYQENASSVYTELVPMFQNEGCQVYLNMAPNVMYPTNMALYFLNDTITEEQKYFLETKKEDLSDIEFYSISKMNSEIGENEECLTDDAAMGSNSNILYNIIDNLAIDAKKI